MGDLRLPIISLKSSQDQLRLKRGWYKDTMAWLNHRGIDKNTTLQDRNNIKNSITSNLEDKYEAKKIQMLKEN